MTRFEMLSTDSETLTNYANLLDARTVEYRLARCIVCARTARERGDAARAEQNEREAARYLGC